ncbi:MAG: M48 family metallopeptidase, partial [Nitrospinota bacterium]
LLIFSFLFLLSEAEAGFGDFLKKVVKPPENKEEGQKEEQKKGGLLEGIGGALGVKEKDLKQITRGLKVVQAMQPVGEDEEVALGGAIAVEAFSRFGGEYKNKAVIRYVNLVGETLVEVSDRPELNFHFAILNSNEKNAFAAPGGYIFITIGLLKELKNEAELAGVLAHEIAHVTRKHMLKTLQRSKLLSNVSELTLASMNKDPAMFSNIIGEMTDLLFTKGIDKEKEFDADVFGIEYAYRAGYNARGLRDFLETLRSHESKGDSRFFSTHPKTSDRIKKIEKLLDQYKGQNDLPFLTKRFKKIKKLA